MKVLEKSLTPDGVGVQLEDWSGCNNDEFPDLHGLCIVAYPIAQNTGKYGFVVKGEPFRLSIPYNKYSGYLDNAVDTDFSALKSGEKTLQDLADHFYDGDKAKWYLGMEVEYQGW